MIGKYWPNNLDMSWASAVTTMAFMCEHITHGKNPHVDLGDKPCISIENELSLPRDSDFWRKLGAENVA